MNNKYTHLDSNDQNWRSTTSSNPQQTYKYIYRSRRKNNNWSNAQITRTITHENQRNGMPIRILGVDSIPQNQENYFKYNDNTTLEYDGAEDYLWEDCYDYGYNPYTNNQMSTFDESSPYETDTDYYDNTPTRDHNYYRMDYSPLNTPYEDENNNMRNEIRNLRENNKQITHEMNCLQDQVRYFLQRITEQNPPSQENKEMNKDFDQPNATICEPQNMKNLKCKDPEIIKDETSLSSSSHHIESNIRINQNNIDKIITNTYPEIPDDNSKVVIEDYVTYQHFIPEHYEKKTRKLTKRY